MPVIPKIAGAASALSSLYDIHKTAVIYSRNERNKAMGNAVISTSIGNQKADYVSFKDAQRKNWTNRKHFFTGIKEGFASVKGYLKGAFEGLIRYIPKLALAAAAIIPKTAKDGKAAKGANLSYISAIALAGIEIWDYLRNGTGLFERNNYLNRK